MDLKELEALLRKTDVSEVMTAIDNTELQAERGWDLSNWSYRSARGSICFVYWGVQGQPTEMLVAVRAPRERRERIEGLVAKFPLPAKLVLLE
jgi:hypothetical protein